MLAIFLLAELLLAILQHLNFPTIETLYNSNTCSSLMNSVNVVRELATRFRLRRCSSFKELTVLYYRRHLTKKSIRSLSSDNLLIVSIARRCNSVTKLSLKHDACGLISALDLSLKKGTVKCQILLLKEVSRSFRDLLVLSKKQKGDIFSVSRAAYEISSVLTKHFTISSRVRRDMMKLEKILELVEYSPKYFGEDDYPKNEVMSFVYDKLFGGTHGVKLNILSGNKVPNIMKEEDMILCEDIGTF